MDDSTPNDNASSSGSGWIWTIVILVLLIIIGWYWYASTNPATQTSSENSTSQTATRTTSGEATTTVVNYTADGFSPSNVTISVGDTVEFVNQSGADMWVASDSHPDHTGYDGTSRTEHCAAGYSGPAPFDECAKNNIWDFTFDKPGTFGYHNHANHVMTGTITVQ